MVYIYNLSIPVARREAHYPASLEYATWQKKQEGPCHNNVHTSKSCDLISICPSSDTHIHTIQNLFLKVSHLQRGLAIMKSCWAVLVRVTNVMDNLMFF